MKRIVVFFIVATLTLLSTLPIHAANGKVTYSGNSGDFIFAPGSDHSPTDLFPNFKGVMPGDHLSQQITVRNDASKEIKVDIYVRALGAHEGSEKFLSQLGLKVEKSAENEMAYMFNAKANETAQLTDWVHLGTLYSGGEVNLDVILDVPVELDNEFQNQIGYLDWEFKIEESPVDEDDPVPPPTGDDSHIGVYLTVGIGAVLLIFIILIVRRREREQEEE